MNNEQLQQAIDATIKVIEKEVKYNDAYKQAQNAATAHLVALYKAQALRASEPQLVRMPPMTYGKL